MVQVLGWVLALGVVERSHTAVGYVAIAELSYNTSHVAECVPPTKMQGRRVQIGSKAYFMRRLISEQQRPWD